MWGEVPSFFLKVWQRCSFGPDRKIDLNGFGEDDELTVPDPLRQPFPEIGFTSLNPDIQSKSPKPHERSIPSHRTVSRGDFSTKDPTSEDRGHVACPNEEKIRSSIALYPRG